MVFEMSIQDFDDQTQDHLFPHRNGGVDYREGSFISEEVKGYQEPGVYHSDSQVGTVFIRISVPELKLQVTKDKFFLNTDRFVFGFSVIYTVISSYDATVFIQISVQELQVN